MTEITVIFYRDTSLTALGTRLFSRRRGQKFASVPSHVGVFSGGYLYEAVAAGVQARPALRGGEGFAQITVSCADPDAALRFLRGKVGMRYDWLAIAFDVLGRILPLSVSLVDAQPCKYDCSRYAESALVAGGYKCAASRLPVSPNDLWLELTNDFKAKT